MDETAGKAVDAAKIVVAFIVAGLPDSVLERHSSGALMMTSG